MAKSMEPEGEDGGPAPILANKHYGQPSAFTPESLLREARRQKQVVSAPVPRTCVLDPDGDLVRRLIAEENAEPHIHWPCYHTDLYRFTLGARTFGIVGNAVGASFAVLVAEELFASGCKLLISITSSGQIKPAASPPYFVLIERALRDEGTSYHYLAPATFAEAPASLLHSLEGAYDDLPTKVLRGATWTTDAPFRETAAAIEAMRNRGILAVEMEAAALYSYAEATGRAIICFAHVTNRMGLVEGDFEKGRDQGTADALLVLGATAARIAGGLSSGGAAMEH